ncbi:HepT-like ribonuclease domain-containing protein [uncultured Salinisphaera sp.]|uniref:HepT-like ribonuclease domain-containing protein n=1 Tax=uncultured Salinisphaera sp. TaxID=359372 RepID=UPI0032B26F7D
MSSDNSRLSAKRLTSSAAAIGLYVREITGYQRAIAFRNILIHGYADIDDEVVWQVLVNDLPQLLSDVPELLTANG